jgi:hypothetical protein
MTGRDYDSTKLRYVRVGHAGGESARYRVVDPAVLDLDIYVARVGKAWYGGRSGTLLATRGYPTRYAAANAAVRGWWTP